MYATAIKSNPANLEYLNLIFYIQYIEKLFLKLSRAYMYNECDIWILY